MHINKRGCNKILCILTIPFLFLLTLYVLNSHLLEGIDASAKEQLRRQHSEEFAASLMDYSRSRVVNRKALMIDDDLDKVYDLERLQMLGIVKTKEDEDLKVNGSNLYAFNDLISSKLSLNRALPDTRHALCQDITYQPDLPKASIIICFFNEAWSVLLRTVHSIINRTPSRLLFEIILIDDASELAHLQGDLAVYLWKLHPNITLLRLPERQGLIRARLYGAHAATGEVLVFLDSHCEVNTNWLEPLLARLTENHQTIAIPVIDMISSGTLEYKASVLVKGGFNWGMHFRWDHLPESYFKDEHSYIAPIKSPTMAGGLFAVYRQYFRDMGEYDAGMEIWGGENLEISFRFWQCGGRLEIIPCSRVGHIFRERRPYGSPVGADSMFRNSVRVARVWMDDYIQYFFQIQPSAAGLDYGNISDRLALREKLKCRPFQWYLKFIYPEQTVPDKSGQGGNIIGENIQRHLPVFKRHGQIKNKHTELCMVAAEFDSINPKRDSRVILGTCDEQNKQQVWHETDDNELLLGQYCLDVHETPGKVTLPKLMKCHGAKGSQAWVWSIRNMLYQLYNPTSGKCLMPSEMKHKHYLVLDICSQNTQQEFVMIEK